jgi:hypothetical protein
MANQYCVQCGAELEAEARFCKVCGAPQSKQQNRVPQINQPQNKFSWPMILLIAGILLLVGGSAFYLFNSPEAAPAVTPTAVNVVESDIPFPDVGRISVEETKARAEAGTAVILDVRPLEDYVTLHAANAISIPLTEINDRFPELPQDKEILTYCT